MNREVLEALNYLKRERRRHYLNSDKSLQSLDIIEKELKDGDKTKQVLENIHTSRDKVKVPLSTIFEGLSQEEKYTLIEHIYYSQAPWQEKYQDLQVLYKNQTHNNEMLQEENQELKKVLKVLKPYIKLDESGFKGFPIIHWCDKYQLFALLQSQEECDLLERWLGK